MEPELCSYSFAYSLSLIDNGSSGNPHPTISFDDRYNIIDIDAPAGSAGTYEVEVTAVLQGTDQP